MRDNPRFLARDGATRRAPRAVDKGEIALATLLIAGVLGSVLAIGAVHVPTLLLVALVLVAAAIVGTTARFASATEPSVPLPVYVIFALSGYCVLQALPMPIPWLARIAPANADVWSRCLLPLGEERSWASISLDPGSSAGEALKWFTYGCAFLAARALAARRGAAWGVAIVFGSAVAAALTTVGHGLAGATKVFGVYEPTFAAVPWHVGPLLNPNNLAGYLNMGVLCGAGLLMASRPLLPRWLVGIGMAAIVAVEVTSASRAGALALVLGAVAFVAASRRRETQKRTGSPASLRLFAVIAAAVVGGLSLASLAGTPDTWTELFNKDAEKLQMIGWMKPIIGDHLWLGVGRGAFESVFPAYRPSPGNNVYTHAESFPVQWASEWGVPVTVGALASLGWALRPSRLGAWRSSVAAGAWVGVVVVLAQNFFDLALEVPAVPIALSVCLGALAADPRAAARSTRPSSSPALVGPRLGPVLIASLGAALCVGMLAFGRYDVAGDRRALRARYAGLEWGDAAALAAMRAQIRAATLRHPADPYFPLVGALVAWRARDSNPMPWLQRSLERAPVNGRAHLLLAEVLAARGARRQALFELRLAVESDGLLAPRVAELSVQWARGFEELMSAVPAGSAGLQTLEDMSGRLVADRSLRALCDREAIARDERRVSPRVRLANDLIAALAAGAASSECDNPEECRARIEAHASAIARADPNTSVAAQLRARALMAEKRHGEAEALMEVACQSVVDRAACLAVRVDAAAKLPNGDRLTAAVKQYAASACTAPPACADANTWIGDLRSGRGELQQGLTHYVRAANTDPTEQRWLRVADAAIRVRAHAQAADALEKVAQRRGGADPELRRRIDAERALAIGTPGAD